MIRCTPRLLATFVSSVAKSDIGWSLSTDGDGAAHRALQRRGIAAGACDDEHPGLAELSHRIVDFVRRRYVQPVRPHVADDADDFGADVRRPCRAA